MGINRNQSRKADGSQVKAWAKSPEVQDGMEKTKVLPPLYYKVLLSCQHFLLHLIRETIHLRQSKDWLAHLNSGIGK